VREEAIQSLTAQLEEVRGVRAELEANAGACVWGAGQGDGSVAWGILGQVWIFSVLDVRWQIPINIEAISMCIFRRVP
jgi:hypothetical protein